MKNLRYIKSFVMMSMALVMMSACTEVYDANLKSSESQYVVEANVVGSEEGSFVLARVKKTLNYNDNSQIPMVSGAKISVADKDGNEYELSEIETGVYTCNLPNVSVDESTYRLNVELPDQKRVTAESVMPKSVKIDSLIISKELNDFTSEEEYVLQLYYTDPVDEENFYHFVELVNGKVVNNYIYDDKFSNGSDKGSELKSSKREYNVGDTVTMIVNNIDRSMHRYYLSLGYIYGSNPSSTPAPANPATNLKGDAFLGYFSAHRSQSITKIVKE